jgi:hypothetical protein
MAELREALESAIKEAEIVETPSTEEASAPAAEASEPSDIETASSVEETGSVEETAPAPETSDEPKKEAAAPKVEDAPVVKPSRIDRAPASWKKEAKGEWANIPLHVRQEVHKREMEVQKVLQEAAPARQFALQFQKTITPYMARLQAAGATNPLQAVEALLQADYALSSTPKEQRAAYMAKLVKEYDIDIVALDNAIAGIAPQPSDTVQTTDIQQIVQQSLNQALAPFMQREEAQRQQRQEEVNHTVESMALDPAYPHFEEVRMEMADIIDMYAKKGLAITLQQAYSKAVRMNDELYEQEGKLATMQTANQQHQQAVRAKNAASSVSGAPAAGGSGGFVGNGDLRSSIEAAFGGARL